jgi:hypothetical protein
MSSTRVRVRNNEVKVIEVSRQTEEYAIFASVSMSDHHDLLQFQSESSILFIYLPSFKSIYHLGQVG